MPNRPKKQRPGDSSGGGSSNSRGLLKGMIAGGIKGGMGADGEFIPYEAERPFWDKVLNQGRSGQASMQGNMDIDRMRFAENLARARLIDAMKQEEVKQIAADKERGQYLLNQLNASDPLDRGRMARLAPSRAAEATSLQTANRADLERAASETNPSLVGNEWLATTKANEAKAQAEMEYVMKLAEYYRNSPNYVADTLNTELKGKQLSNTGRERTNTQAGLDIEKAQAYNRDVMPTANQAAIDQYSNVSAMERARRGVPGLFNSLAGQENQMALSLRPDLAYRSDTLGQGPYTAYSPGGNIHNQVPVPGAPGLTRDLIQYQPPGFRQIGQQQQSGGPRIFGQQELDTALGGGQARLPALGGRQPLGGTSLPSFNIQGAQQGIMPNANSNMLDILETIRRLKQAEEVAGPKPIFQY